MDTPLGLALLGRIIGSAAERGRWRGVIPLSMALAALPAQGAIMSVTGPTWLYASPPANVGLGTQGSQFAFAWNEKQQITVSSLQVDILGNSGNSNFPTPGLLSGVVDSHMLHWEPSWILPGTRTGTVAYNNPIVGVIFTFKNLNLSDPACKPVGTIYSQVNLRGLVPFVELVKVSGSTLTYTYPTLPGFVDYCDVRVLTAVAPGPGSALTLVMAGLVAMRRRR